MAEAEMLSVKDYVDEAGALQDLHDRIASCDAVLAGVEGLLQRFQGDLGSIGGRIRSLQEQSASLSTKLGNRREASQRLGQVLESLVVPPSLIQTVTRGQVDEAYAAFLAQLSGKLEFLRSRGLPEDAAARRDVEPELNRLRLAALHRIRGYLLQEFQRLSRGKTNVPVLQSTRLLPLKHLMRFAVDYGPEAAGELRAAYVSTRGRGMSRDVAQLLAALGRMRAPPAGRGDLLGGAAGPGLGGLQGMLGPGAGGAGIGALFGARGDAQKAGVFRAGPRLLRLREQEATPLVPFVEIKAGRLHPVEVFFRCMLSLLSDACTSEFLFCLEFFDDAAAFDAVAAEAVRAAEAWVEGAIGESHDLIGLLLMVRTNWSLHLTMQRRRVPCLDALFDRINLHLWPRIKLVLGDHLASLGPARDAALRQKEPTVHPATRRVADLLGSLYQLCADTGGTDPGHMAGEGQMEMAARQVEAAYVAFLGRHGAGMPPDAAAVFRVNNLDALAAVLREVGLDRDHVGFGAAGGEAQRRVQGLLDEAVEGLGMLELRGHFGSLVDFVERHGLAGQGGAAEAAAPRPVPVPEAEGVARSFEATWERQTHNLRGKLLKALGNMLTGQAVLKVALTHLVILYRAFLTALSAAGPEGEAVASRAVKVASIMYEIKSLAL